MDSDYIWKTYPSPKETVMLVVGSQAVVLLVPSQTAIRAMGLSSWLLVLVGWEAIRLMNPVTAYGAEFCSWHTDLLVVLKLVDRCLSFLEERQCLVEDCRSRI